MAQYISLSSFHILHRTSCSCHPSFPIPSNRPGQSQLALMGSGKNTWSEQSQSESFYVVNTEALKGDFSFCCGGPKWGPGKLGSASNHLPRLSGRILSVEWSNDLTEENKGKRWREKDSLPNIIWATESSHAWIHLPSLDFLVFRTNLFSYNLRQYNIGFSHLHRQNPDK